MTETVIVAVLGFLGTAVGSFSGMKLMSWRIEQLERKVERHNQVMERTFVLEEKMKVTENRLLDLERHEEKIQEDLTENLKNKG